LRLRHTVGGHALFREELIMRFAVIGAGAVGGYFGGRLAQSGEEVWFLARGRTLQSMRQHGLKVDSTKGNFSLPSVRVSEQPNEIGAVDVVLVAVKAWQISELAPMLKPLVGPHTLVVPLQNGVEAPDELSRMVGKDKVLIGLCGLMSTIVEPGYIRHFGLEPFIAFKEQDNSRTPRLEPLREAIAKSGVQASIPEDIHVRFWLKFLFITAAGGVGSVSRSPVGIVRQTPATRQLLCSTIQEIDSLAKAKGVKMPASAVDDTMAIVDGMPPGGTTSMQRDILEGRPSELESLCGAVVRIGKQLGLDLPVNTAIYSALLPSELRARGELRFDRL
jgi:2-dehydropantoate 2-reductase